MATWERAVAAFARELNGQTQAQLSIGKNAFLNYCLAVSEKCCIFANRKSITERAMIQDRTYNNESGDAALQGVFLNVSADD